MYRIPSAADVTEVAEHLGITLTADEAAAYQRQLATMLANFDEFLQIRPTVIPPRYPGNRDAGYRPSAEEDPYGAWMWKCSIPGAADGLLTGKTVSYKDHIAVAGLPLTFGAYAMEGHIADYDATVVSRALEQGAEIIGKNVMNGLAGGFGFGGGFGDYGRPKNPHNPDHLTGGSSSGSAAALAAGEVDISYGGDQGGSIRMPASWSGIVGLKPTFGLVSHFGITFGSDQSIDYTGPMARTVADCAIALEAVAGYDGLDPRQTKEVPDHYDATSRLDEGVEGLRVGIMTEGFAHATPDVSESVHAAADVLAGLGAKLSEVSVPEHQTVSLAQKALGAEGALAIRGTGIFGAFARTFYPEDTITAITRLWQHHNDQLDPRGVLTLLAGAYSRRYFSGRLYARAQNVRPFFIGAYDRALADVDVLIMPTTPMQAPKYEPIQDRLEALEFALTRSANSHSSQNTQPFDFTGHPALSIPGEKKNGLPVGVQLVGPRFGDDLLLRVGQAYANAVDYEQIIAVA
ncbi:amidase [Microlunatus endophyticus]|uniref:Amidase n=1 Tax=Microlunatus endophyticus TaxID=1716077 RepID=A0A917W4L8_9ACTN|nr:amidase family protein [Microlunatus endophyticus]GGL67748.1 amidase [Microlunatus endophyticus]